MQIIHRSIKSIKPSLNLSSSLVVLDQIVLVEHRQGAVDLGDRKSAT